MKKLRIKSYRRKSFYKDVQPGPKKKIRRIKGTTVKGHLRADLGKIGRGPKIIPITRKGILGKGFFKKSRAFQEKRLSSVANKFGESSARGMMAAQAQFHKRTNPQIAKRAAELRTFISKKYGDYRGRF